MVPRPDVSFMVVWIGNVAVPVTLTWLLGGEVTVVAYGRLLTTMLCTAVTVGMPVGVHDEKFCRVSDSPAVPGAGTLLVTVAPKFDTVHVMKLDPPGVL